MAEQLVIVAMGASTPVGRTAWSSAAAVRAGISRCSFHPYMVDTQGEPMRVAIASWIDLAVTGPARLQELLFPALDEALLPIRGKGRLRIGIALGLPSSRPGLPEDTVTQVMARIVDRYTSQIQVLGPYPFGHAAGLIALKEASARLLQGSLDVCVVAGADSYINPLTLEWVEECDQLHGAGLLNNAWGFIPGEASGALLVMRAAVAGELGMEPLSLILDTGSALEAKRIKTETVCLGEGLTQAFRTALMSLPTGARVTDVYCDLNGEPYRADEFGFATLRTRDRFESASHFIAPADCWGDVSAAGGPLHLILATIAGRKAYAKGPHALVWASSETGERAATLVTVTNGKR